MMTMTHQLRIRLSVVASGRSFIFNNSNKHSSRVRHQTRWSTDGWTGARGHDITGESLTWGDRPKVNLTAFSSTGIDVQNIVKKVSEDEKSDGTVHMHGSIMAFPFGCFLWKVHALGDVTVESLAPVLVYRPKLDYLFIGCSGTDRIPLDELRKIQTALHPIVVEQMAMSNAIGTFNILNAEDRQVAAALVLEPKVIEEADKA